MASMTVQSLIRLILFAALYTAFQADSQAAIFAASVVWGAGAARTLIPQLSKSTGSSTDSDGLQ